MGKGGKLKIKLEPVSKSITEDELKKATEGLMDKIKWRIGVTPELEIVEINTLPRFELKAKRVIKEEE
jgi:phenylacetate-coenzyme A ligase PaaK-like adenylate-forming protein